MIIVFRKLFSRGRVRAPLFGFLLPLTMSLFARTARAPYPAPQQAAPAISPDDAFAADLDAFIRQKMEERHVPGAAVVVVRGGGVLALGGYGLADVARGIPVDPERTVFRCGSVSKLLTATAAMQMVERGLIDLNADVNVYLRRFKVPAAFGRPVTLGALLTHTAGFSEYIAGQHKIDRQDWLPLGDYLARRLPRRILPPGEVFIYNDHGMSLAGFVVEEASGAPFARFVDENIFAPLGMKRSTFLVDPPAAIAADLATGYRLSGGRQVAYPYDYVETIPAAGLLSTAADMARFMLAHLGADVPGGGRILRPETIADMQRRHFAHDPRLERGRAYGFSEMDANGARAVFHDGGMPGFNSRLVLVPERGVGFFAVWNSDGMGLKYDLTPWMFDRLAPRTSAAPVAAKDGSAAAAPGNAGDYRGYYRENEGLSVTMLKLGRLADGVPVVPGQNGAVRAFGSDYLPLGRDAFRSADGQTIVFRRDESGRVRLMFAGTAAFDRARWFEKPDFHYGLMALLAAVFLPAGIVWPIVRLAGRKRKPAARRRMPRGIVPAGAAAVLVLVFLVSMFLLIAGMEGYWPIMKSQPPWSIATKLLVLPLVIVALTTLVIVFAVRAWRRKDGTPAGRVFYSTIAAALIVFVWFCAYWNLFGFRY